MKLFKTENKSVGRYKITIYTITLLFGRSLTIEVRKHEDSCPIWPLFFIVSIALCLGLLALSDTASPNKGMTIAAFLFGSVALFSFVYGFDRALNK